MWLLAGAAAGVALARWPPPAPRPFVSADGGPRPVTPPAVTDAPVTAASTGPEPPPVCSEVAALRRRLSSTGVDVSGVHVECADGVVDLRGQVRTSAHRKVLELAALDAPGVSEVRSWLRLAGRPAPTEPATRRR